MKNHSAIIKITTPLIFIMLIITVLLTTGMFSACENEGGDEPGEVETVEKKLEKPQSLELPEYTAVSSEGYTYDIHSDGGLIYNPLYREAKRTGVAEKYDGVPTRKVTVMTDGFDVEFEVPYGMTAYDVVPVKYKMTVTDPEIAKYDAPLTLEITSFEEDGRSGENGAFDLAIPGSMSLEYKYLGYVNGTYREGARNIMKRNNTDTPAASYPNFDTTELNPSGTVKSADLVWLKFAYTNTGNTILDAEGIGNFNLYPVLYRKNAQGAYELCGYTVNNYVRELSYMYPGETREFWLNFQVDYNCSAYSQMPTPNGLCAGDYKLVIQALYRTELNYSNTDNLYHGRVMQEDQYLFTVGDTAVNTEPREIKNNSSSCAAGENTPSWLHYFEEFMTTFEHFRVAPEETVTEGTLYIQVAPWTQSLMLKVIYSSPRRLACAEVPISVETDSLFIKYDADNINVVINEEGYEEPAVNIQTMPDMRANIQVSPYPEKTILQDMLTLKDCGVNLLNWQCVLPWFYDNDMVFGGSAGASGQQINPCGDGLKYALDLARQLGFKMLGAGNYPYGTTQIGGVANWLTGERMSFTPGSSSVSADFSSPDVARANAMSNLYLRSRWGDIYWSDATGVNVYTEEDTRGFMRFEHQARYGVGNDSKKAFREWCREKYGSIEALNTAWSSNYRSFLEIDPEAGQPYDDNSFGMWVQHPGESDTPFYEWSPALIDFDIFRTSVRVQNYEDIASYMRTHGDPDAAVQMRTEGSLFIVPGLDGTSGEPWIRQMLYAQLKGAAIAEMIVTSDAVQSYADYTRYAFTPSQVRYMVRQSVDNGIIPMLLPQFHDMREIALNDTYGIDYSVRYNYTEPVLGAYVQSMVAVYPWWVATYEEGGVPGTLWQDLMCNGFVTETQIREIKFFSQKIDEMLADPKVKAQTKASAPATYEIETGKYTFDPQFIADMIASAAE